jgi:hypothetical protein
MGKAEDVLKGLGFNVGGSTNLLHTTKDQQAEIINKGFARGEQSGRQGMDTARSRLDGTLSQNPFTQRNLSKSFGVAKSDYAKEDDNGDNYGAKYAKQDTSMHSDASEMEAGHDKAEEVDSVHGADEEENMAVRIGKKVRTASTQLSNPMKIDRKPTDAKMTPNPKQGAKKSLSQEELFLKALDGIGHDTEIRKSAEMDKCSSEIMKKKSVAAKKGELVDWAKEEEGEKEHKKTFAKKSKETDRAQTMKSESVGDICDSLIEVVADPNDPEVMAAIHENSNFGQRRVEPEVAVAQKSRAPHVPFLKSAGPGGFVFDFGRTTGNPMADAASILLAQNADPQQLQTASDQERASEYALTQYVQKGDAAFSGNNGGTGVNEQWAKQMSKPMDQQVQEAFDAGAFAKGGNPAASTQDNQNKKDFAKSTATLNGETLHGMSETDAAVLEMFKAEQAAMGDTTGMNIIDAQHGGAQRVTIDAGTGKVH